MSLFSKILFQIRTPLFRYHYRGIDAGAGCLSFFHFYCGAVGQEASADIWDAMGYLRQRRPSKTAWEVREICTFLDSEVGHYWDILKTQMSLSAYTSVAESLS